MGIERPEVVCPFYSYDDGVRRVVCEGLTDSSTLSQRFARKKQMERFMEHYCYRACTDCQIFGMILRAKYPDA